ncbi:hypothetical protein BCR37DRAFT_395458 [Protomyces lactucae-debilis]|uniref:Uncharacterized protein n=1 Tax=Protomyces lactucae-debilis TaxID=2754530 RepID=A0A1Y2EW97_PROLT|nr:uncharacterized protein BCR37DRAFT_395458 [Protomyces lactucae-debilis]ORY75777.1 hypothetical protein BCR37DRAFT_395458 [Protomyces lactucae-debilis]
MSGQLNDSSKAPLAPGAGSVPVPDKSNAMTPPSSSGTPSLGHDVNSANVTKDKSSGSPEAGFGTSSTAQASQPPNWTAEGDVLEQASHGRATGGTVERDVDALKREQNVDATGGEMKGPTGLPISGKAAVDGDAHDAKQAALLAGRPSADGAGSAGLPYDAGN